MTALANLTSLRNKTVLLAASAVTICFVLAASFGLHRLPGLFHKPFSSKCLCEQLAAVARSLDTYPGENQSPIQTASEPVKEKAAETDYCYALEYAAFLPAGDPERTSARNLNSARHTLQPPLTGNTDSRGAAAEGYRYRGKVVIDDEQDAALPQARERILPSEADSPLAGADKKDD